MKTNKRNKLIGLALTGSFSLFGATNALAAAGDPISNTATLGYSVGGSTQTVIESSAAGNSTPGVGAGTATTFVEDRVINFTIADNGVTGSAVPGGAQQVTTFTLLNSSNATLGFLLKGANNLDGTIDPQGGTADEFDASSVQTFVESGANLGYQPLEDTVAFVGSLAAGASIDVHVVSTIPLVDSSSNPLVNGNVAVMTLIAQAAAAGGPGDGSGAIMNDNNGNASPGGAGFSNGAATLTTAVVAATADNPGTMDTVFNDQAGTQDGTGAADALQNAQHSADNSYTIATAALSVTKTSAALWDFVNLAQNPKSIPGGSIIRYTVRVDNTGTVAATLTDVTDILPLVLDTKFGDGTDANLAVSGVNNVRITDGAGTVTFCQADNGDTNTDGCRDDGGVGNNALEVILGTAAGTALLNGGEFLTVEFDVILP